MNQQRPLNSLVVVAPFYNEQDGARAFYEAVCRELDKLEVDYQFVFVDDGSRDKTLAILNEIADADPRVTVLSLARNFGHQIALTAGLDYADADAVVTMDGDLQHPPQTIAEMVAAYENGAEVVYAVRANEDNRNLSKRIYARVFYRLLKAMTRVDILEGSSDFRLISRLALEGLHSMREKHRFLRGMIPWMGFPYQIVTYEERARSVGQPKYTWRQSARLARHGFFSFSTAALDMITLLGLGLTGLAGLYLIFALLAWAVWGDVVPGWTSVIAVLLVVSGVQLISVGILAQYIGMIFEEVKDRPLYMLKQKRLSSEREVEEQMLHVR